MIYTHNDINPFISCDDSEGLMIGRNGEFTIGYQMELPAVFTLPEEVYTNFSEKFCQGIKILPAYSRIHRQDFIALKDYNPDKANFKSYFEQEYAITFSKRPLTVQHSYIYFTLIPREFHDISVSKSNSIKTKGFIKIKPAEITEFKEKVEQFISIMSSVINQTEEGQPPYIRFTKLSPESYLKNISSESDGVLAKYLFLQEQNYSDITYNPRTAELRVGKNNIDIFSVSSLDNMPAEIQSCLNYDTYNLPACWGAFTSSILKFQHIVNTYIIKGDTEIEKINLERRKNMLESLSSVSRSNSLGANEIDTFLQYTEEKKASIIDFHTNIIVWDKNERELAIKRQSVNTMLATLHCENPKAETYNKLNLFIASMPGNAINIFSEYRLKTLDIIGANMSNFTSLEKIDYADKGKLRVTDRLSKSPILIDPSEPYNKYNFNKNKFCVGGSGSGKSFTMNHYLNNKLENNAHCLVIDIGRSYEGLCSAYNGKWFEFTQDSPLSFNPFILTLYDWNEKEQILNDEKAQALCGIIKVLWKGPEGEFDQTESVLIKDLLTGYYQDKSIKERKFDTFYEYALKYDFNEKIEFQKEKFFFNLKTYYKSGNYSQLLNANINDSLLNEKLIIFELDNIKDNKLLLSVITTIITDIFVAKMRNITGEKIIMFEEAWAALSNEEMSGYIQWLAKTARKFDTELIIVTQELNDIVKSKVGAALINNCSTKFILDQSNFKSNFNIIQETLGLTDFQKAQVLSLNKGKDTEDKSRDVFIGHQYGKSFVIEISVSRAEALLYTSNQDQKQGIRLVAERFHITYANAIKYIIENLICDIDHIQKRTGCNFLQAVSSLLQLPENSHLQN